MKQSENFKFKLPEAATDNVNIEDLNDNFKAIDKRLGNTKETISGGFTTVSNSNEWVDLFIMEAEYERPFITSFTINISDRPGSLDASMKGTETHTAATSWRSLTKIEIGKTAFSTADSPRFRRVAALSGSKIIYQINKAIAAAGSNVKVTLTKHAGEGITYTIPTAEQTTAETGSKIYYITDENDIQTREDVKDEIASNIKTGTYEGNGETLRKIATPSVPKFAFISGNGKIAVAINNQSFRIGAPNTMTLIADWDSAKYVQNGISMQKGGVQVNTMNKSGENYEYFIIL